MASLVTPIPGTGQDKSSPPPIPSGAAAERWPRRVLVWLRNGANITLTVAACVLAVFLVGMSPVNARFRNVSVGNEVFVYTDNLQSKILVPARSYGGDWGESLPAEDFPGRDPEADYVAFSWGDREFCTTTSDWSRASAGTALKALLAPTPAVVHVEFCRRPQLSARYRRIVLTDYRQRNLTEYLYQSFARKNGSLQLVKSDVDASGAFYQAKGTFCLLNTGNNWTGTALKRAGVRTGIWTPLPFGLAQVDDSPD